MLYNQIDLEQFECSVCKERGYYKERNCSGTEEPYPVIYSPEVRFLVSKSDFLPFCPKILFLKDEVLEILHLYSLYKKGIMYEDGGYLSQPWWYIEAMRLLESEENRYEKENLEKLKRGKL